MPAVATTDYVFGTPLTFPPVISGSLYLHGLAVTSAGLWAVGTVQTSYNEGYIFDGADGSQMAFWTCHETAASAMTWEQFTEALASRTHPRRLSTLEELANVAVFMASDRASRMTGTIVNLAMGSLDD